jgi:hypothetical protein
MLRDSFNVRHKSTTVLLIYHEFGFRISVADHLCVVDYLTDAFIIKTILLQIIGCRMNDELEMIWKEAVVT